jgi:hypothetical protein
MQIEINNNQITITLSSPKSESVCPRERMIKDLQNEINRLNHELSSLKSELKQIKPNRCTNQPPSHLLDMPFTVTTCSPTRPVKSVDSGCDLDLDMDDKVLTEYVKYLAKFNDIDSPTSRITRL